MAIGIEFKNKSGIYRIKSAIDNKIYIGSAACLYTRAKVHFTLLRQNKHHNIKLQRYVNKYGIGSLDCLVVEVCEKCDLIIREQHYIDTLKPYFNVCQIAQNSLGYKFTAAQCAHLSKIRKGIFPGQLKGTNNTPDARLKISQKAKERGLHPAFMLASKLANIGRKQPENEIIRRSLAQAKINKSQSEDILKLYSDGIFQKDIAIIFNVSQRVINKVINKIGIYGSY